MRSGCCLGPALVLLTFLVAGCQKAPDRASSTAPHSHHPASALESVPFDRHLLIDQFGYRPQDPKVAVIRNPHHGYDSNDPFIPGREYQIRRSDNGEVVHAGALTPWNEGAIQPSSGDAGWWFDFSDLRTAGEYFVYDVDRRVRSAGFRVDPDVYRDVLRAAMRTYFYQRSGMAKEEPYADKCWTDKPAYTRRNQDVAARDITDPDNRDKVRDVSGGWFDAGDTNKYVTNLPQPIHQLLNAYRRNPDAFTDDFNIPESGNGIPDVLDEVRWEIQWLKKMQYGDGSVALKVGSTEYVPASPPSSDRSRRFYVPACTSSTIAAAGVFAHTAIAMRKFDALKADAQDAQERALLAWESYMRSPVKQTDCDTGIVHAGDADLSVADQNALAAEAAIYLFAATADPHFEQYLREHYKDMQPYRDSGWSRYRADQGEALLFYTEIPHADPDLKGAILADKAQDIRNAPLIYGFDPSLDLYRSYLDDGQYHWGSNNPRANYGNTNLDASFYRIDEGRSESFDMRALETLHYFHGVNPFTMVYLSNMYRYGATVSANEIYHTWFWQKSKWSNAKTSACGPAPGFVPGGPNANATADGVPAHLTPPAGQPPQKSYKDWNTATPESSWAVTEPAIYFQSAYIRLLSSFVAKSATDPVPPQAAD